MNVSSVFPSRITSDGLSFSLHSAQNKQRCVAGARVLDF